MHLNKKGLSWQGVITGLILTLVVGGILIYWVGGPFSNWMFSMFSGEKIEREICRKSVELNAQRLDLGVTRLDPFVDVKCKTIPLEVGEIDTEKIKKVLADHLYMTWVDFGRGKNELFGTGWFNWYDKIYCRPRYMPISFKSKVEVNNFVDYLAKEKPEKEGVSYWRFLTGRDIQDAHGLGNIPDSIDTNKDYAIVFMLIKTGFWQKWVITPLESLGGGIVGYLVGYGVGAVVAFIPVIGVPLSAGIIATTTTAAATVAGVHGYMIGTSFEDYSSGLALVPYDEVANLGCEY